mgnify:CR=1 FL=1
MTEAYIYDAVRTPRGKGKQGGSLNQVTPIHLAAKYGFKELATKLLDLPDARYAHSIANVDGLYPDQLARASGHQQLGCVLQNFREAVRNVLSF